MIKVEKNFVDIPPILQSDNRKIAFDGNIVACDYVDEKDRYKVGSVQKRLNIIYHLKCAYCEKKLLDTPKHIEHFRPKKGGYYWLAYSWDNLLLSCGECNSAKGNKFPIANQQVSYNNESFENIHNLSLKYDRLEQPQIINPEREDVLELLKFDNNGEVSSDDIRVENTIGVCKLNREPLTRLRREILDNFREEMEGHLFYYCKLKKDSSRFIPTVQQFIKNSTIENKFYTFRYYILNNIEEFFENRILQKIVRKIINQKGNK